MQTHTHTSTLTLYVTRCAVLSRAVTQPCNEGYKSAPWTAPGSPELVDIRTAGVRREKRGGSRFQHRGRADSDSLWHSYCKEAKSPPYLELPCIVLMTKQSYSGCCTAILAPLWFRWNGRGREDVFARACVCVWEWGLILWDAATAEWQKERDIESVTWKGGGQERLRDVLEGGGGGGVGGHLATRLRVPAWLCAHYMHRLYHCINQSDICL